MRLFLSIVFLLGLWLLPLVQAENPEKVPAYVPAFLKTKLTDLTPREKEVLYYVVKASTLMDRIFFLQVYAKNPEALKALKEYDGKDKDFLEDYFRINFGPFDRLEENRAFFGNFKKPAGAGFYPEGMGKKEFTEYLEKNPQQKERFESPYTLIVREKGELKAVPYPQVYEELLKECVEYLNKAASLSENKSLKKYLQSRANDLLTNDYFQSDCDWLDILDNHVELVIGPYEVYEDDLFNYKAAYESFVYLNDIEETARVQAFIGCLKEMQDRFPVDKKYLSENIPALSPLKVADLIFSAGDAKAGVNSIAFALPNDEKVRELKGSKKIILQNMMEAKYKHILFPIAEKLIANEQLEHVRFKSFLYHVILHELSHPLGTDYVYPPQEKMPVRKALKETYSLIEEAKADVAGLYNALLMIEKKVIPTELKKAIFVTQLASMFRSMRFGEIGRASCRERV